MHPPAVSQEKLPVPEHPGAKSYAFSFGDNARAELRITGDLSTDDLADLETYLEVTMRGLKRSKERSA